MKQLSTPRPVQSDSDEQTESEGDQGVDNKLQLNLKKLLRADAQRMTTITHKEENDNHFYKRLVSQGTNLTVDHLQALRH